MPAEGCDKAVEEMWCCLMVSEPDRGQLASVLPPGTEIPDVSSDFFPSFNLSEYSYSQRIGRSILLIAIYYARSA